MSGGTEWWRHAIARLTSTLLHWARRLLALRRSHPVLLAARYLPLASSHSAEFADAISLPGRQAVLVASVQLSTADLLDTTAAARSVPSNS